MKQAREELTEAQQSILQSIGEAFKRDNERANTLATLSQVSQELFSLEASPGELERLLQQVAASAQEVLGADVVTVYQYVQDRDEFLVPPVQVGELCMPNVSKDKVFDDDVVITIVKGAEPLYSPDAQGEPQLSGPFKVDRPERPDKRFVVREGIVSSAAVPLKAGTETVGVMFVNYRKCQPFTEDQRGTIALFANQAAVAIHNARLYEQASQRADTLAKLSQVASQRADTLARLSQVGQALISLEASPGKLERLLRQVAASAQEVLGADVVTVYQYVQDRDEFLVPPVQVGELRVPNVPKDKVFNDDVVITIVQGKKPLYSPDAQGEPQLSGSFEIDRPERPEKRFVVREGIVSSAAVPLKAGTETVGVMFVNYRSPQPFTEGQRGDIELFANQAAVAIHNARLYEQASQRADTLARLNQVGQALVSLEASPAELERALLQVAENAQEVLGADVVAVYQYVQDRDEFLVPPVQVGELRVPDVLRDEVFDDDVVVRVVRGRNPLYSPDAQSVPLLSDPYETKRHGRPEERFVVREGIVSSAAVLLGTEVEIVGVMFVNYRNRQPFTKAQREVIELFANQAAVAIRNARLFELVSRQDELQRAYTALKEEQERRIAAEKLKAIGQAAANLAHKMNNLGGIIPVCVQELREQVVAADADVRENLDIIEQQARRLLHAANDLLRPFAPSEEGEFDVNELVNDALQVTYPLCRDRIVVEFHRCETLPKVKTSKLLGDVFIELITNATKAMPNGGKLEIEARLADGRMIEITFADTGCGIPSNKQKWIFESFGAFEPESEGERRPGIRFGLWWVKAFLQQQGGDIELRWSEVGKGSRFVISHPAAG